MLRVTSGNFLETFDFFLFGFEGDTTRLAQTRLGKSSPASRAQPIASS